MPETVASLPEMGAIKIPLRIGSNIYEYMCERTKRERDVKGDVTRERLFLKAHHENQKCYKIICLCQRYAH